MLRLGGSVAPDFEVCFAGPAEDCLATLSKFFGSEGFFPPSVDLCALDVVNSEVTCLCALLRLINPPASVSISAGAASPRGRDTVSEQCRAVRDTMLHSQPCGFQTPQNADLATVNQALGAAGQRAGVGSAARQYFLSFSFFFFKFPGALCSVWWTAFVCYC